MTLNITLAGPRGIYQASDCRLTNADTRAILTSSSPKQVEMRYRHWRGIVAYCGIGQFAGRDTSDWLAGWLTSSTANRQLSYQDAVSLIREQADHWYSNVRRRSGDYPHSFIIAAYVGAVPEICVISNFESTYQAKKMQLLTQFEVSRLVAHRTRLYVSGKYKAVDRSTRRALLADLRFPVDPMVIRKRLAAIIAKASLSPESDGTVSSSALVYSILRDGEGGGEAFGAMTAPFMPPKIFHGADTRDSVKKVFEQLGRKNPTFRSSSSSISTSSTE